MTPCEKLGYKVGDRFECTEGNKFAGRYVGDILILKKDDGSDYPWFENVTRKEKETVCYLGSVQPLNSYIKSGDEVIQGGKKYRVTLEKIPQYEFKPGMICRVDWGKADAACVMHSDCDFVIFLGSYGSGKEKIAYAATDGTLTVGCVNTSSLRPE